MWYFPPIAPVYTTAAAKLTATLGVADIWASGWLWDVASESGGKVQWEAIHHNGSRYRLWHGERCPLIIDLLAVHLETTLIRLGTTIPDSDASSMLGVFWAWVRARRTGLTLPSIDTFEVGGNAAAVVMPPRKRPGPKPSTLTIWVREQVAAGATPETLLVEYMIRRGDDPADEAAERRAREALRKTIERGRS